MCKAPPCYYFARISLNIQITTLAGTMENDQFIIVKGQKLPTDSNGYLLDHSLWSEDAARVIAVNEEIELNEEHWLVIHFVRDFYEQYDTSPAMRALVKALNNKFGPDKGSSRYLYRLLPKGPAKLASKLAGLPKPAKCL